MKSASLSLPLRLLNSIVLVLVVACHSGTTPREAAEGYLGALAQLNFDAAAQYVSEDGKPNFDYLKKLYASLGPEEQKKFQVVEWSVTGEQIQGETATVDFTFDGSKKGQLSLQRVKGLWKVNHRQSL